MADPKGILFFFDDLDSMEQLNFEERGRLFTALLEYARDGCTSSVSGNERFLFPFFQKRVDRDFEKYQDRCERNRRNAEKRWHATACDGMPENAKTSQKCQKETETKKETEKEIETKEEAKEETNTMSAAPAAQPHSFDYGFFQSTFNRICTSLPACRAMTDKRKKAVRTFLTQFEQGQWEEICEAANISAFLSGNNDRGWRADFDFLLKPEKAAKVLEGAYNCGSGYGNRENANPFLDIVREEQAKKYGSRGNGENPVCFEGSIP